MTGGVWLGTVLRVVYHVFEKKMYSFVGFCDLAADLVGFPGLEAAKVVCEWVEGAWASWGGMVRWVEGGMWELRVVYHFLEKKMYNFGRNFGWAAFFVVSRPGNG